VVLLVSIVQKCYSYFLSFWLFSLYWYFF